MDKVFIGRLLLFLAAVALLYILAFAAFIRWRRRRGWREFWESNRPLSADLDDVVFADDDDDAPVEVAGELVVADPSDPAWLEVLNNPPPPPAPSPPVKPKRRRRKRQGPRTRPSVFAILVMTLAALGLPAAAVCVVYAWQIEPFNLAVTNVTIALPQMRGKPPLRIVQITDLHCDGIERTERLLPDAVASQRPDIIVFTGDVTNGVRKDALGNAPLWQSFRVLQAIAKIRPQASFACMGNRDTTNLVELPDILHGAGTYNGEAVDPLPPERRLTLPMPRGREAWDPVFKMMGESHTGVDFRLLVGETVHYTAPSGASVRLAGGGVSREVDDEIEMSLKNLAAVREDGDITILLGHYPSMKRYAVEGGIDLHLAGDTHNGQIVMPLLGPLVRKTTHDRIFYPNALMAQPSGAGGGKTYTFVGRGIGMDNIMDLPPWRFNCGPEIVVIDLVDPDGPAVPTPSIPYPTLPEIGF